MDLKTEFLLILEQAEKLYGPRDVNFTINKVKIIESKTYAETIRDSSFIDIHLTSIIDVNLNKDFQMSHEAIHCLNPCKREECNYLEEAVAVHFSLKFVTADSRYRKIIEQHDRYREAFHAFESVPGLSDEMIQKLRLGCRSLSGLTLLDLTTAGLGNSDNKHLIKLTSKAY